MSERERDFRYDAVWFKGNHWYIANLADGEDGIGPFDTEDQATRCLDALRSAPPAGYKNEPLGVIEEAVRQLERRGVEQIDGAPNELGAIRHACKLLRGAPPAGDSIVQVCVLCGQPLNDGRPCPEDALDGLHVGSVQVAPPAGETQEEEKNDGKHG